MKTKQPWENFDDDLESRASPAPDSAKAELEDALELQMVSIRLQKSLIANLKQIAEYHGVGYQPLIRDLLTRFTKSELGSIVADIESTREKYVALERIAEESPPYELVDRFLEKSKQE